ncbi:MAG: SMP-30/gluconolactonase/LRE family protein [Gammaproteobacteria bacterium]
MVDLLVDAQNHLGECVLWCDRTARVLWTDILGSTLHTYDPVSGDTTRWPMPERLASFALTQDDGRLLLGLASGLAFFEFSTGKVTPVCTVEAGLSTRLNDGRCDRQGNFVFGSFNEVERSEGGRAPIGAFYRLNAQDLSLERLALKNVAIANSICFSPDGATMYYCDSPDKAIRRCDYPSLANDRVFAQCEGEGEPDGSCIDAEGYLWNAQWGGYKVVRYAPDGSIDMLVDTPAAQPSCVGIGGAFLDTLFVSSARVGLDKVVQADGGLLAAEISGLRGLPECRFGG